MDQHCIVFLTSWWSHRPDPAFLDEEMREVFVYGQAGVPHNKFNRVYQEKIDIALSLFGENFFNGFENQMLKEMWNELDFLSFDITLTANSDLDGVVLKQFINMTNLCLIPILDLRFGLNWIR